MNTLNHLRLGIFLLAAQMIVVIGLIHENQRALHLIATSLLSTMERQNNAMADQNKAMLRQRDALVALEHAADKQNEALAFAGSVLGKQGRTLAEQHQVIDAQQKEIARLRRATCCMELPLLGSAREEEKQATGRDADDQNAQAEPTRRVRGEARSPLSVVGPVRKDQQDQQQGQDSPAGMREGGSVKPEEVNHGSSFLSFDGVSKRRSHRQRTPR